MAKDDNIDGLDKTVRKKIIDSINSIASDIIEDIQRNYQTCIDAFYDDYSPDVYNRTFDTYYGISGALKYGYDNDIKKYSKIIETNDGWELRILLMVTYQFLHNYYHDKPSYVFDRTWNKGIHGYVNIAPPLKPSPHKSMNSWFSKFKKGLPIYIRERFLK